MLDSIIRIIFDLDQLIPCIILLCYYKSKQVICTAFNVKRLDTSTHWFKIIQVPLELHIV